jgi:hypothetical protein
MCQTIQNNSKKTDIPEKLGKISSMEDIQNAE